MKTPIIILHERDNVGIARADIDTGDTILDDILAINAIKSGHKVATKDIKTGDSVLKFGQHIGTASTNIQRGEHVHIHNITAERKENANSASSKWQSSPPETKATFQGYVRADGSVGTRNYIGILTTVNCAATVARQIAEQAKTQLANYPNVDGVVALTHTTGCGTSSSGEGTDNLRRTIAGFAQHANFSAVLIIGLGCEANQLSVLLEKQSLTESDRLKTLQIQQVGGTRHAISQGLEIVENMMEEANKARRSEVSASHLSLGLQCGGSDALSGVTANPSLGVAVDMLVRQGGTAILAETPEIYGAEELLLNRAETETVSQDLLERIAWWEDYVARNKQELNNNPSPGNLAGGLTTILEKSLGAVAKSGSSPLCGVYQYAEIIKQKGLVFMDSPGYDPCSVTGEIASGANMICFTTGRGSVFGAKPVPSLKIASNSNLATYMDEDIDVDAGQVAMGTESVEDVGARIFQLILDTASGHQSKSEEFGFGDMEFVPWQIGATI